MHSGKRMMYRMVGWDRGTPWGHHWESDGEHSESSRELDIITSWTLFGAIGQKRLKLCQSISKMQFVCVCIYRWIRAEVRYESYSGLGKSYFSILVFNIL